MTSAGELKVRAGLLAGELHALAVDLRRPSVTPLFTGQLPDVVIKTVPYLYTLCAAAQRTAAQAAVNVALGEPLRAPAHRELWLEFLHENLWRLLLDWPPALGLPAAREAFVAWRARRYEADVAAITQALVDDTLAPLAKTCLQGLGGDGAPAVQDAAATDLDAPAWLAYWQGMADVRPQPAAPGRIAEAYAGRLADVRRAILALQADHPYPVARAGGDGWGVGQTLTARGVLTHAIHVVDGQVARYRVQAPTDGLFADARPLHTLLAGRRFASAELARQALDQAVLALDPCLPYTLDLSLEPRDA